MTIACSGSDEKPPAKVPEDIFAKLGEPLPTATVDQKATFERGKKVLLRRFTPATGLGPKFNVVSCGACHERPVPGGGAGRYRNFILQGQALPDGSFTPTGVNGIQDQFTLEAIGRVPDAPNTNRRALRNPIPFFGVGLIAEIPESSILAHADPDDKDHDGISGRPNHDKGFVGRFGRKAQTVSIENFIRGPLFNHIGITTDPLPDELKAKLPVPSVAPPKKTQSFEPIAHAQEAQAAAPSTPTRDDDGVPDPELSQNDLFDLVSFSMLLAVPEPDPPTDATEEGRQLFSASGCDKCHVPTLESPRGLIPLYSDLLLHDMGPDLADGIKMGEATGSEFRTQPLWGVAAVAPYLHNGSADTLDDAIRMHGGEAEAAKTAYVALSDEQRQRILDFLASLGGASQKSDGLLPPGAPVPDIGQYGGPMTALSGADLTEFEHGRALFDRDTPIHAGLGTTFNGDACRSCHFDPVIGGAGPSDVDVTRQGVIDASGAFTNPATGTMLHHQSLSPVRPDLDPASNCFELRQTPPLFGLGLVDSIPDANILANADPNDADGDGISGRAAVLSDGRIGRFGWKANVPSLAEFARDALSNELGLTVSAQPGLTFGNATDTDSVADPEIAANDIDAIVFFMSRLGPPPRTSTDAALESAGQTVFTSVGCAKCHIPSLAGAGGVAVPLYSDLLLHDILPASAQGIAMGVATEREFRTAPLWGLAKSAPYMHNGRAFTVEDAILAHDGEAVGVKTAYQALSATDKASLKAFLESL